MADQPNTMREEAIRRVLESEATKSDMIRELNRMGCVRAEIAKRVGVRYQFVRNVLVNDERRNAGQSNLPAGEIRRVADLTKGMTTKADKIRALDAAGFSRSAIADALSVRYQHVRNTLVRSAPQATPGLAEARAEWDPSTEDEAASPRPIAVGVGKGGRVALPPEFQRALGIGEGDEVLLRIDDGEVRLYSRARALERVQDLVAKHVPADVSLVDELIAERRREAERENRDG